MIHIVIGTKAQLVKVAPLMLELQNKNIEYNFIFTGQHQQTMDQIRDNFDIKSPDTVLHRGKDITSIPKMLVWIMNILWKTLLQRKEIFKGDKDGVVLVHGDTFSTLLGALMGRLAGFKVAHIESGLRSHNIFHPFPEELTRLLTFKLSNIYLCPGSWAIQNLQKFSGEKVNTEYNTLLDSLKKAVENFDKRHVDLPTEKFGVCTTHRFENIFSKEVFSKNLSLIEEASKRIKILFILHPVTEKKLHQFDLYNRLESNPNIELRPRYDYFDFIKLVYHSEFVISDGGSNQEECFYMGKPCILLRKATERQEGLGQNIVISKYNRDAFKKFLGNYENLQKGFLETTLSPVEIIVQNIQKFQN